jgi:hypothetical protein
MLSAAFLLTDWLLVVGCLAKVAGEKLKEMVSVEVAL